MSSLGYVDRLSVHGEIVVRGETECAWRSRVHGKAEGCMERLRMRGETCWVCVVGAVFTGAGSPWKGMRGERCVDRVCALRD